MYVMLMKRQVACVYMHINSHHCAIIESHFRELYIIL